VKAEDLERIKSIKRANEKRWLAIDGVVAVGIGATSSGDASLIVSVKEHAAGIRKLIPHRIENVEVEIRETGEFKAQSEKRTRKY
jgi:hypothetical protein